MPRKSRKSFARPPAKSRSFRVTVNYGRSVSEMIEEAGYEAFPPNMEKADFERRFGAREGDRKQGKEVLRVNLFAPPANRIPFLEIEAWLKSKGCRSMTLLEGLHFGKKYPGEQLKGSIYLVGSVDPWVGMYTVPVLTHTRDGRGGLGVHAFGKTGEVQRYAAVVLSESKPAKSRRKTKSQKNKGRK